MRRSLRISAFIVLLACMAWPLAAPADPAQAPAETSAVPPEKPTPTAEIKEDVLVRGESEVPAGWSVREINGVTYWCKREMKTGSRIQTQDKCVTPTNYELVRKDAQKMLEDISRGALNPKGG